MGLVTAILTLPIAPLRGVIALGRVIQEQVDRELNDPARARRELEAAEEARAAGELTRAEEAEVQERVVEEMTTPAEPEDEVR